MRLLCTYAPDVVEKNDEKCDDIASYLISFKKVTIKMISRFAFLFILVFFLVSPFRIRSSMCNEL